MSYLTDTEQLYSVLHRQASIRKFSREPFFSRPGTSCRLGLAAVRGRVPPASEGAPSWRDASAHPWRLPPAGTALRRCIDDTFIAAGLVPPPACIESSAIATNLSLLAGSSMLSVVSRGLAQRLAARGDVALLPLTLTSEPGAFGMVWHASGASPGVLSALQALRQTAADITQGDAS